MNLTRGKRCRLINVPQAVLPSRRIATFREPPTFAAMYEDGAATDDMDLDRYVDALCDRFEREWKADSRRIEDFLVGIPKRYCESAIIELLRVELELRKAAGDEIVVDAYAERFP